MRSRIAALTVIVSLLAGCATTRRQVESPITETPFSEEKVVLNPRKCDEDIAIPTLYTNEFVCEERGEIYTRENLLNVNGRLLANLPHSIDSNDPLKSIKQYTGILLNIGTIKTNWERLGFQDEDYSRVSDTFEETCKRFKALLPDIDYLLERKQEIHERFGEEYAKPLYTNITIIHDPLTYCIDFLPDEFREQQPLPPGLL